MARTKRRAPYDPSKPVHDRRATDLLRNAQVVHRASNGSAPLNGHPGTEDDDPPYWAVCRAFSNRVHWLRPEIEKTNHGTFMPTYVRVWSSDGKLSIRERALMPGYLFFRTDSKTWGEVRNVDGVYDVLSNNGKASKVSDAEMHRLVMGHILGDANEVDLAGLERAQYRSTRRQSRRPRASKRARGLA